LHKISRANFVVIWKLPLASLLSLCVNVVDIVVVTDSTGMRRSAADIFNNLAQRNCDRGQRSGEVDRPGLSAGISGAGFGETGSLISSVSSRLQAEAARNKLDSR